jgi:GNAT superfamily N-acetyltransferase
MVPRITEDHGAVRSHAAEMSTERRNHERGIGIDGLIIRVAERSDVDLIADVHRDSIQSVGAPYYPADVVAGWLDGVAGDLYVQAMERGEVFFIAIGRVAGATQVLGFSSDYPIEGSTHGTSVYVRGIAARQGVGTALLRQAEAHARATGAAAVRIEASLAGAAFYRANGYVEMGRGEVRLLSGHSIGCVSMRKSLAPAEC